MIATGIRSNSHLARQAGLEVNQGVVVNDRLATSHPDVFAAGDVAEHRGQVYGIWGPAQYQGSIAGLNMAGGCVEFGGIPRSNTLKVLGLDLFSIGRIDAEDASFRTFECEAEGRYFRFVFRENRLVGAVLLGDTKLMATVKKAVESGADLSDLLARCRTAPQIMEALRQVLDGQGEADCFRNPGNFSKPAASNLSDLLLPAMRAGPSDAPPHLTESHFVLDWDRFVADHGPPNLRLACRILGHGPDAEDAVQEAFLQVYQIGQDGGSRQLGRPAASRGPAPRRWTGCGGDGRADLWLDEPPSREDDPQEAAAARELADRLRQAVGRLPQQQAAAFCMRYFDDQPYEQIAENLGVAVGAVASALHKARGKLKSMLAAKRERGLTMDNEPRADDLPDEAELSGPVRDAIEQIRREKPSDAMLARVLERARQIAASSPRKRHRFSRQAKAHPTSTPSLPEENIACSRSQFAGWPPPPPQPP